MKSDQSKLAYTSDTLDVIWVFLSRAPFVGLFFQREPKKTCFLEKVETDAQL